MGDERIGVVGAGRAVNGGRRLLTMSDGTAALVEADLTFDQIAERHRLDRVVAAPVFEFRPISGDPLPCP